MYRQKIIMYPLKIVLEDFPMPSLTQSFPMEFNFSSMLHHFVMEFLELLVVLQQVSCNITISFQKLGIYKGEYDPQ